MASIQWDGISCAVFMTEGVAAVQGAIQRVKALLEEAGGDESSPAVHTLEAFPDLALFCVALIRT